MKIRSVRRYAQTVSRRHAGSLRVRVPYITKKQAPADGGFLLFGAGTGTRPALRGRPPRVARRTRRLAKSPRVQVPSIPNAKSPRLTAGAFHIWCARGDLTMPAGQAASGCDMPPACRQVPSGSSPIITKRNQPSLRMTDSFWCARGDLNPHARNEH